MGFTPFKDSYRYLNFLIIFLLTLLLLYLIIPLFISGTIKIWVNISELDGAAGYFSLKIGMIMEIILMGPVFGIIYYFLMKSLIKNVDENQGRNKYVLYFLEIGVLLFINISVMGHIVHLLFDYGNWIYRESTGMDTSQLYSFLYYSDEWLGHHLIHIAFFGYITLALITEFIGQEHRKLNSDELIYTIASGVGLSVVFSYYTYEGQAAFMIFILFILLLIIEIIILFIKKINPLERPILLATIITSIVVIIFFICWIILFGIKPYYPFVYQPSEL